MHLSPSLTFPQVPWLFAVRPRVAAAVKLALSGPDLCRLMRAHGVTIRELARRTGFTMKRIREVRQRGLQCVSAAVDWKQAVIGEYTAELQAEFRAWLEARDAAALLKYNQTYGG